MEKQKGRQVRRTKRAAVRYCRTSPLAAWLPLTQPTRLPGMSGDVWIEARRKGKR